MIGLLASSTGALLTLAVVFALLVGAVIALESPEVQRWLRRYPGFRRFEQLSPAELRYRGMLSLGLGICGFAALVTLRLLFPATGVWTALAFGLFTVVAVTVGAALLERAAHLDGHR